MEGYGCDYINGYIERQAGGKFDGVIKVEGIDLSPIHGVFFKHGSDNYLWLKRKDMLVYDHEQQQYRARKREPRWEAYLEKQLDDKSIVAYKGIFYFMRWKFSIVGIWDSVLGMEKSRINLFVERLPMEEQDIINKIRERNEND